MAETFHKRLKAAIEREEDELEDDEQLALVYYPPTGSVRVIAVGCAEPDLLVLYGIDQRGKECTVAAHVSAVSLVIKREKITEGGWRHTVGFVEFGDEKP
jgi:hypothetical protein